MRNAILTTGLIALALLAQDARGQANDQPRGLSPERRAVAFLSREVPRWRTANKCYSCHNNGDGARALLQAAKAGVAFDRTALRDSIDWLGHPQRWADRQGDGEFKNETLSTIQFASALRLATRQGLVKTKTPLTQAAEMVVKFQEPDGSWKPDRQGAVGSPVTYGTPLATAMCLQILSQAGRDKFRGPIAKAEAWLRQRKPVNVPDAAATLIGLAASDDDLAVRQRRHCLDLLRRAEDKSGGWGPFASSAPEPFDTGLALLGLAAVSGEDAARREMIQRGRRYLVGQQLEDGSWPETTRPPGAESYAQRVSTTAWAAQALLATRKPGREPRK